MPFETKNNKTIETNGISVNFFNQLVEFLNSIKEKLLILEKIAKFLISMQILAKLDFDYFLKSAYIEPSQEKFELKSNLLGCFDTFGLRLMNKNIL